MATNHDRDPVSLLRAVARSALSAVQPTAVVTEHVSRTGDTLSVAGTAYELGGFDRVVVLAFGKAASGMAAAVLDLLPDMPRDGVVASPDGDPIPGLQTIRGGHPKPDRGSVEAGRAILDRAEACGPGDLVFVLISGGGSAIVAAPAPGVSLSDLDAVNDLLLRSGADIAEINTVRKHLSEFKGGQLASRLDRAGALITLIISDVIGNDLTTIASGPTVPDPTTFSDALAVLDRYAIREQVPHSIRARLEAGAAGRHPETPKSGMVFTRQVIEVVADGERAAASAVEAARDLGHPATIASTRTRGEARDVAPQLIERARTMRPGEILVFAGETTVTVRGEGRGGRNQELALAAAIELDGDDSMTLLSIGTDGVDGPTDAAGAVATGSTVRRARDRGMDAAAHLARNDSNAILAATGDLVVTGPTGTNVGDLILVMRHMARP